MKSIGLLQSITRVRWRGGQWSSPECPKLISTPSSRGVWWSAQMIAGVVSHPSVGPRVGLSRRLVEYIAVLRQNVPTPLLHCLIKICLNEWVCLIISLDTHQAHCWWLQNTWAMTAVCLRKTWNELLTHLLWVALWQPIWWNFKAVSSNHTIFVRSYRRFHFS